MAVVLSALILVLAYLLFAGQVSTQECVAALCCAALAMAYAVAASRAAPRRFRPARLPWLHLLAACATALPRDTVRVGRVLLRAIGRRPDGAAGGSRTLPFREGGPEPRDAARRALATLGLSLAPDGYVLRIPAGEDTLHLHVLSGPPPAPRDRDWPL